MAGSQRAERILRDAGAVLGGDHFVYITGEHGDGWIDKDSIFPRTELASELCSLLADELRSLGAELVCGPATGGLIVSQWTGHHLGLPSLFADHGKEHGYDPASAVSGTGPLRPPFVLKRGYDLAVSGRRVLVVDDVINTGESIRETVAAIRGAGGEVTGIGALCTRGNAAAAELGCDQVVALCEISIPSWPAADCELCHRGVPVNTRFAHGADFVAAQR